MNSVDYIMAVLAGAQVLAIVSGFYSGKAATLAWVSIALCLLSIAL